MRRERCTRPEGKVSTVRDRKRDTYISFFLFIYFTMLMPVCLSVCLCVYLSVCLSDCLSVHLSVCMYVCLSVFDCVSLHLFVYVSLCVFISLSVCMSVHQSICVFFPVCFYSCFLPSSFSLSPSLSSHHSISDLIFVFLFSFISSSNCYSRNR